jgi:hypothetical protein
MTCPLNITANCRPLKGGTEGKQKGKPKTGRIRNQVIRKGLGIIPPKEMTELV